MTEIVAGELPEAGPLIDPALARRLVEAVEGIALGLDRLADELPRRIRNLELAIDQKDLR